MESKKRAKTESNFKQRKKRRQTERCKNGFRFHPETCKCEPIGPDGKFIADPLTKPIPRKETDCEGKDTAKKTRIKKRIQEFREEAHPDEETESGPNIITPDLAKPPTRTSYTQRNSTDTFSGSSLIVDEDSPVLLDLSSKKKNETKDLSSVPEGNGKTKGSQFAERREVRIQGVDRVLDFKEWKRYKEVFIKRCIDIGTDLSKLDKIKREVLGGTTKRELNPKIWIGKWWLPTQREKGFWKEAVGTDPTPAVSPTISSILEFKNFAFTDCTPSSWNPCFVATVHEFIRTEYDSNRIMPSLHNLSVAGTPNGHSRHRLWGQLRKAWIKGKKSVFGEEWMKTTFYREELLKDGNLTKKKVQLNNIRSRRRQTDQLDVSKENMLLRVDKGRERFVEGKGLQGNWADKAVWLALVCGARKIEIIFMSQFRRIDGALLTVLQDLKKIQPGADTNRWVRQIGLAKKKDGDFIPVANLETPDVYKPLLGSVTVDEFIAVWEQCRAEFHDLVQEVTGRPPREVTREEAGDISKGAIASAFRREYHQAKLMEWVTGDTIHFHTLRAIYGNISHKVFAKGGTSLAVWVGKVLGHDMNDSGTALFYQTINVTEKSDVSPEKAKEEFDRLNVKLKDLIQQTQAELKAIREMKLSIEEDHSNVRKSIKLWSTRDSKQVEFRPNRKRGDTGLSLLKEMMEAGVPLTTKNLRALGYGSNLINKIHKKISQKGKK